MTNKYNYCFIRKDLAPVHQIIQLAHATFETGSRHSDEVETPNICLFEVESQIELLEVANYLRKQKIEFFLYQEPDFDNDFTAISCNLVSSKEQRAIFKKFKLYGSTT